MSDINDLYATLNSQKEGKIMNCFYLVRFTVVEETHLPNNFDNMMPELFDFNEKFSFANIVLSVRVAVDNNFEICLKMYEKFIKTIRGTESEKITNSKYDG